MHSITLFVLFLFSTHELILLGFNTVESFLSIGPIRFSVQPHKIVKSDINI